MQWDWERKMRRGTGRELTCRDELEGKRRAFKAKGLNDGFYVLTGTCP